ncbi:MAG: S8 family serine peptidase [Bacteroidetes bacterium]|nr:S8 family serine peptidase [Bacteroidota bacterium]
MNNKKNTDAFFSFKKGWVGFLFLCNISAFSQVSFSRYWVGFTDKNGSPYSVSTPLSFLSQRAINRRTHQGFSITAQDFPVNPNYIQQVRATGALVMCRSRWFNGVVIRISDSAQLLAVQALSCVQNTKPLAKTLPSKPHIPYAVQGNTNERTEATQSNVFNYGASQGQIYLLNGQCLHNQNYNGSGMQIAVIDDGFIGSPTMSVFDSLWHNHQVLASHDFFNDSDTLAYTEGGHGSEVLSCMASNLSGQLVGTAPYAHYYLLRSEIDSTEKLVEEYQWVSAIEYADSSGADVVNSSLGYTQFDDAFMNHTWADLNGRTSVASMSATLAARRGMIVCVAAGNEGNNAWRKISVPADADSILAVGATDSNGNYANFSSVGNTADGRIKPDVAAQGVNTALCFTSNSIATGNGTSFASPTIAGLAACLWQGNPSKTNMQIIQAIKQSASQYSHPDSLKGYGIPNFCIADQILKGTYDIAKIKNNTTLMQVFPNPSHNVLYVITPEAMNTNELQILNTLGELMQVPLENKGQENVFDISALPNGVYFIRTENAVKKFIKQ